MHQNSRTLVAALMLCAATFQANAAKQPLADCVDLTTGHQAVRSGSQYLAVKDGETYYRLGFDGSCSALLTSTQVRILTDGTANRLCPEKSQVQLNRDSCNVTKVERIEAEDFARYKRLNR